MNRGADTNPQTTAMELLARLVALPSPSRGEQATAALLEAFLHGAGVAAHRTGNNVWARSEAWVEGQPTVLLCSHHDTVQPAEGWTRDPYTPTLEKGRLYGLGTCDAGASAVALTMAFLQLHRRPSTVNLMLALVAEEEVSGAGGIRALLPELEGVTMGIVGEPTQMEAAVGERGLVVLDGVVYGRAGHAARNEGCNAIHRAVEALGRLQTLRFERESAVLGPVGIQVTQIEAGRQHNVVPDVCRFVIDVRTTDAYTNEQVVERIGAVLGCTVRPRSTHLRASALDPAHPLVRAACGIGCRTTLSPTLSDRALLPFPSLKIGPGDSVRSHTADEWIAAEEVADGIDGYVRLIGRLATEIRDGYGTDQVMG